MLRIGRSLPQILLVWIVKLEKQQDVLISFLGRRDGYVFLRREVDFQKQLQLSIVSFIGCLFQLPYLLHATIDTPNRHRSGSSLGTWQS
jgi:hypothetical protein